MAVTVVAIITPKEGAKARVQEVVEGLAKNVESSEPGTLQYQYFWHEKEEQFVFIETYKDMAALQAHTTSETYVAVMKAAQEEDVLAKPVELKGPFDGELSGVKR